MDKKVATIAVRTDKDAKDEFIKICKEIGMSPSEAVNIYIKKVISKKGIPFPVKLE